MQTHTNKEDNLTEVDEILESQMQVNTIAATFLGKKGGDGYKDTYDKSLLVRIPRRLNRKAYSIEESNLPFVGVDVWNAYEVSALTEKGFPVTGVLKIFYWANSEYHVESKSLKLYLNSFNMTKMGSNSKSCIDRIVTTVQKDLFDLLEAPVIVNFFDGSYLSQEEGLKDYPRIQELVSDLDQLEYTASHSNGTQLDILNKYGSLKVSIDFLRSNCRVTNQPDWGTLFIHIKGSTLPDLKSLAKYVVSHRKISHFHEEVVEMVYKHLLDRFTPEELVVGALYTRRGGIDINPIRASDVRLIPSIFYDKDVRLQKTLMQ